MCGAASLRTQKMRPTLWPGRVWRVVAGSWLSRMWMASNFRKHWVEQEEGNMLLALVPPSGATTLPATAVAALLAPLCWFSLHLACCARTFASLCLSQSAKLHHHRTLSLCSFLYLTTTTFLCSLTIGHRHQHTLLTTIRLARGQLFCCLLHTFA